jgi:hypothetical protein
LSEYQYYEFLAIDRPLIGKEQDEIRSLSTRARITATSFVNEYHWGDFHGNPNQLMERYFDAHLYLSNWGMRRVMFRLPRTLLDVSTAEEYCVDGPVDVWGSGGFTVLDFTSEDESGEYDYDDDGQALLSAIVGVRAELIAGDLRPLYLAWLAGCSGYDLDGEVFEGDLEPPVPPGLGRLTAAQSALAEFLRVDKDLLSIAAENSPPLDHVGNDPNALAEWVKLLPEAEKNRYLMRIMQGEAARVGSELQRRYRDVSMPAIPVPIRRTVAAMFESTAQLREEVARRRATESAEAEARRVRKQAELQAKRLDALASDGDIAWTRVDTLIAARKPAEYDIATVLLTDLQALAEREGKIERFKTRIFALRYTHARKVSLIERLDKAGI